MIGLVALVFAHLLLYLLAKALPKTGAIENKVSKYLYWSLQIRFMIEVYMDVVLCALMNVESLDWSSSFEAVQASNYLAVILTVVFCSLPIFFIYFYAKNVKRWNDEVFQLKYGTLLKGTNQSIDEKQWIAIMVPTSYFLRRLAMCLSLVFWREIFWVQVAGQLGASTVLIILVGWY